VTTVWGDLPFLTGSNDNGACGALLPALACGAVPLRYLIAACSVLQHCHTGRALYTCRAAHTIMAFTTDAQRSDLHCYAHSRARTLAHEDATTMQTCNASR